MTTTNALRVVYHPDPIINAEVAAQAVEAERIDLAIGYPPRAWTCECGATHSRGHFMTVGVHRCLKCGYVGPRGVMHGSALDGAHDRDLLGDVQRGSVVADTSQVQHGHRKNCIV